MVVHLKRLIITFFLCPQLTHQRNLFFNSELLYLTNRNLLGLLALFGSELLDNYNNKFIFQYVRECIGNNGQFIFANMSKKLFIYFIIII